MENIKGILNNLENEIREKRKNLIFSLIDDFLKHQEIYNFNKGTLILENYPILEEEYYKQNLIDILTMRGIKSEFIEDQKELIHEQNKGTLYIFMSPIKVLKLDHEGIYDVDLEWYAQEIAKRHV